MNELKTQVEQVVSAYKVRLDKAIKDGINSYPKSNPEGINEKNYRSRLNLEIEKGVESDAAIYSRVVDLGNFVIANFDKLTEDMIRSYLHLCQSVERMMGAKDEEQENQSISLNELVSQTERIFIKFNNFSSKGNDVQLAILKNALDEGRVKVRKHLDMMKKNAEHISTIYINNIDRVANFSIAEQSGGAHERIDTVYYAAMDKVKDLLDYVEMRISEENNLGLLDDALRTSYDLCLKTGNMLTAEDVSKFQEANTELIREINKVRNDYYGGKVEDGEMIDASEAYSRRMVS